MSAAAAPAVPSDPECLDLSALLAPLSREDVELLLVRLMDKHRDEAGWIVQVTTDRQTADAHHMRVRMQRHTTKQRKLLLRHIAVRSQLIALCLSVLPLSRSVQAARKPVDTLEISKDVEATCKDVSNRGEAAINCSATGAFSLVLTVRCRSLLSLVCRPSLFPTAVQSWSFTFLARAISCVGVTRAMRSLCSRC